MRKITLFLILILAALPLVAQVQLPRASPTASVSQTIGTTKITIDYHRPGMKGRTIWGDLVPFGKVWRTGANEATTITFTDPVKIEGKEVAAGKYALFTIPGADKWTFILSSDPGQFGAFSYDEKKDSLRVEVTPSPAPAAEWMRFTIEPTSPTAATIMLNWEKTAVPIRVEVDVNKIVWSRIDAAVAAAKPADSDTFVAAAQYAADTNQRLDEGLTWADKSIAVKETLWNQWVKARLLHAKGRSTDAVPFMEKSIALAKGMPQELHNILNADLQKMKAAGTKK